MIILRQKNYADPVSLNLYRANKIGNDVHSFGVNINRKIHHRTAKKANNPHAIEVFERAARIDALNHNNKSAAIKAREQKQILDNLTPKDVASGVVKAVTAPLTAGAEAVVNPGPTFNKVVKVVVKNPYYATGELLDDASTGLALAYGSPKLAGVVTAAPLRAIGASAEGVAKIFPKYRKRRSNAYKTYNNSKFSKVVDKITLKNLLEGGKNVPENYIPK